MGTRVCGFAIISHARLPAQPFPAAKSSAESSAAADPQPYLGRKPGVKRPWVFFRPSTAAMTAPLAVLHASTPADVIGRLETMAMNAGLNLILQHEQIADSSRKITCITEVNDIFRIKITDHLKTGKMIGELKLVNQQANTARFKKRGIRLEDIFYPGA
jgi:hypothetical protein